MVGSRMAFRVLSDLGDCCHFGLSLWLEVVDRVVEVVRRCFARAPKVRNYIFNYLYIPR